MRNDNSLWLIIFLLPTFFQRLFVGGEGQSYEEYSGVALTALGYICHLAITGKYLASTVPLATTRWILVRYIPIVLVTLAHIPLLVYSETMGTNEGAFAGLRQLLWIFACLAMVHLTNSEDLLKRIIQLTHVTFIVIVFSQLFYWFTNIPLQLILSAGSPRAQGFLTEPSATACLIAGYTALAATQGNYRRVLYAICITTLVSSVIAFIGLSIGLLTALIQRSATTAPVRKTSLLLVFLTIPLLLIVVPSFSSEISFFASELISGLEGSEFSNTAFYSDIVLRILQALTVLDRGFDLVKTGLNISEGGLFRFTSFLLLIEGMQHTWHLFFGYGLGAHAQTMVASGESVLDFGFMPLVISSFGVVIGFFVFIWLISTLTSSKESIAIYAVAFSFVIIFNSAGGIHMYSIALLSALLISRQKQYRNKIELKVC